MQQLRLLRNLPNVSSAPFQTPSANVRSQSHFFAVAADAGECVWDDRLANKIRKAELCQVTIDRAQRLTVEMSEVDTGPVVGLRHDAALPERLHVVVAEVETQTCKFTQTLKAKSSSERWSFKLTRTT